MKKVVLKLDVHLHDDRCKQKAMKMACSISGLDSISMDTKDKTLTLIGDIDPVAIVSKLRKVYYAEIVSVGPVKEPEKKKDEPRKEDSNKMKDDPNKGQNKKDGTKDQAQVGDPMTCFYVPPYYIYYHPESVEENPNSCVIC